jgi:hypothetical protein
MSSTADVGEPVRRNLGVLVLVHAAAGSLADVDHRVGHVVAGYGKVFELPVE